MTTTSKLRLYLDDGSTNPAINLKHLQRQVHAMFCQWVRSNYHVRDFIQYAEALAEQMALMYLTDGSPELPAELVLPEQDTLLSPEPFFEEHLTADEQKPRLLTASGDRNPEVSDSEEHLAVIAQLFASWAVKNYHPRDFVQAVKDAAVSTYYDYDTLRAIGGGLGGGPSLQEFLRTCPAT